MKNYLYIKSKREFIRERRKALKPLKKLIWDLRSGCAMPVIYGEHTLDMQDAIHRMEKAFKVIDEITKKLR